MEMESNVTVIKSGGGQLTGGERARESTGKQESQAAR